MHHLLMVLSRLISLNLGVIFQHSLSFESHVVSLLKQCSQRIYLLKMLRSQSIPPAKLHIIFRAIVVSRILYALPACTYLVHSPAELMPSSSAHTDVGWLASSVGLLLMISFTVLALGCLRKCVTQVDSTHCLNHLLPPRGAGTVSGQGGQTFV